MKKALILSATLAVVLMANSAMAQLVTSNDGLAVWHDVRATAAAITTPTAPFTVGTSAQLTAGKKNPVIVVPDISAGNLGGPGDGQTLFMSPRLPLNPNFGLGLHWTGFKNKKGVLFVEDQSVKDLHTYITVESRGGVGEVISALGRDSNLVKQGLTGNGNLIEGIAIVMDAGLWDGTASTVTDNGLQESWTVGTKAVKIPVAAGPPPVYDTTGGAVPAGIYHVATTTITAGVWDKAAGPADSTYLLNDSVNNLLMTRAVSTGVSLAENPDFGYTTVDIGDTNADGFNEFKSGSNGGIPEAHSGGSGSVIGTTSVEADATIVVNLKGDYNNSGTVTGGDVAGFNAAILAGGAVRQRELYLGDFNNSATVTGGDVSLFNTYIVETGANDCAIPANCP